MHVEYIFIYFSSISFLFYGINSFFSNRLISEYERWGYKKLRVLIACSQILASIGLLVGMLYPIPLLLSIVSFLLALMMLVAIFARIRINDTFINTLPAIIYTIVNFLIFYNSI